MSCSYAEGLSPYENKGKLGLPESVDKKDEFEKKVKQLSKWIEESKHVVIHTGAGISTAAGIPDFRGPNGVWTLEKKGIKPTVNISFDDAKPTPTHMAIVELVKQGKVHYVVSQNIDALHLRSGLSRKYLAELHGNMYVDQCSKCERQFVRKSATNSVGQKNLGTPCPYHGFRPCRGTLHDTILDWEHNLPQRDINLGDYNSSIADLSICLGTTLQINPSGMLPTYTKKYNGGKLVICNLSSTKHDKKADLVIRGYVDDILIGLMKHLGLAIPEYDEKEDPSRSQSEPYQIEWTLLASDVSKVKRRYEEKMKEKRKMKKENAKCEVTNQETKRKRKTELEEKWENRRRTVYTENVKENDLASNKRSLKIEDREEEKEEMARKKRRVKTKYVKENEKELESNSELASHKSNLKTEDVSGMGEKNDLERIKRESKTGEKEEMARKKSRVSTENVKENEEDLESNNELASHKRNLKTEDVTVKEEGNGYESIKRESKTEIKEEEK